MGKRAVVLCGLCLSFLGGAVSTGRAQDDDLHIRVDVNLVQLDVAVTDKQGNYITGLRPEDFSITEDQIPEKIATFGEGNGPARSLIVSDSQAAQAVPNGEVANSKPAPASPTASETAAAAVPANGANAPVDGNLPPGLGRMVPDANVFILFDTSDYMYRGFVYAQDAIAEFVRSLGTASKIAFYSYSRDLSRVAPLTSDRGQVLRGVRTTVAGDQAALYNCLLLTVKDAAKFTGRKIVVVFSNGPDNASLVPPEDVAELAESTGTVIYMISTREAELEPISTAVFERMSKATGGKAYFAKTWLDETKAFASILDDLAHLYSISYYPQPNPSQGWRTITVKLVGSKLQKYHVRTRDGYRLQITQSTATTTAAGAPINSSGIPSGNMP